MVTTMTDEDKITTAQAIEILGVSRSTFQKWKRLGYIKEAERNPRLQRSSQAKYLRSEIEHFMPPKDDAEKS